MNIRSFFSRHAEPKLPPRWVRIVIPTALIAIWFTFAAFGGPLFGKISEVAKLDLAAFLPNSAESTKVNKELTNFQDKETLPAIVVFERKDKKELTDTDTTALSTVRDGLEGKSYTEGTLSPTITSEDNKGALLSVPLNKDADAKEILPLLTEDIAKSDSYIKDTMEYRITGPAGFSAELGEAFEGIDGILLLVALGVVLLILLVVYRSPVLPFLVLITSIFALTASILVVFMLAKNGIVTINGQVQGILFILVIGAATDYSLLYVARYREELQLCKAPWNATHAALRGSFEPIIASGSTVIAGLLCLLLSDLASNTALGPVGAIGIVFAMASALTFLPVLLLVFGRTAFWPFRPVYDKSHSRESYGKKHPLWNKIAHGVLARPRILWIGVTLLLLGGFLGVTQLKADGVPQSDLVLGTSTAREGQAMLERHFPASAGTPVQIVAPVALQDKVVAKLEADKNVDTVNVVATGTDAKQMPVGRSEQEIKDKIKETVEKDLNEKRDQAKNQIQQQMAGLPQFVVDQATTQALSQIPSVDSIVEEAYPFKSAEPKVVNDRVLINATLKTASDSDTSKQTVQALRSALHPLDKAIYVGGYTAIQHDTNVASIHDRTVIIPAVLVAITLILMVLLRSILAPILLTLTTVISFGTTLGIAAWLFNGVWNFPGADPSVVLYGFVFLVALGIDYNIFLMTRVREESQRLGTKKGIMKGLVVTGGVITSAGIVLAATFAALAVIPILFLFQLAFIVAFGVLLDTIIIRSILVPALFTDLGSVIWWPSKLRKKR